MTMQLHSFLRTGIHSGCGKAGNLLDSRNRSNRQFTVKTVHRSHTTKLQKSPLLHMLRNLRNLLISQEHFHHNTVCKIRDRENQDGFFITDLSCFHFHNLTSDNNLSHLSGDRLQRNRFPFEVSSINNIRVAVLSESATEIALLVSAVSKRRLLLLSVRFLLLLCSPFRLLLLFLRFLFRIPGTLRLSLILLTAHLRMTDHILHFLRNLNSRISPVFTFLCFHKIQIHTQVHSTSLTENLMKILDQNLTFLPGDHRIRKDHTEIIFPGKSNLRLFEHIVLKHIVITQFQFHTRTIRLQKILWRILPRQTKFLDHRNRNSKSRKKLPLNLIFQLKNMLLVNPPLTSDINPDMRLGRITGNLRHQHHIQQLFQLLLHF